MNASYLLAGTVSMNLVFFAFGPLLVLAWKTAVTAELYAVCPFSIAEEYAVDRIVDSLESRERAWRAQVM